jgi:hypothetical protein
MSTLVIRRTLSAVAGLAVALVVPVVTTGPSGGAEAKPRPVPTAMRSHTLHEASKTSADGAYAAGGRSDHAASDHGASAVSDTVELQGGAQVVGVSWPRGSVSDGATVEIRERRAGTWGAWEAMDVDPEEGPDAGSATEKASRGGTAPYISTADAVQVRVVGGSPAETRSARLDVVDATVTSADEQVTSSPAGAASAAAIKPTIYSRADWGADESIRHAIVDYATIKSAVIHHTAGSNSYSAADVPSIIRGIYVFHTDGRGWGDIGYNFLVDRYGRTWEGRWGGVDQPMVGAHAGGYNSQTFGASVLGDFTTAAVPSAVTTALSQLVAWKLGLHHIDPTASTVIDGKGTMSTVIGHRDLNPTSCPGDQLYAQLGAIRSRAKEYQGTMLYQPAISRTSYAYRGSGVTVSARAGTALTWKLSVTSVCRAQPEVVLTGATGAGTTVTATWNGRDDSGRFVPPGTYRVRLSGSSGSGTLASARSSTWTVKVKDAAGSPSGYCPPRLAGADRYATAVAVSRENDPSTQRVVIANGTSRAMGDALVAGPLAEARGAVLLLTRSAALPSATRAELERRGVREVTVVGGTVSVTSDVVDELKGLGATDVSRIGGANRWETSALVARAVTHGSSVEDAFVASGDQRAFPDGLALSGPATALGRPVLLVSGSGVPRATEAALTDLGLERTVVAGGTAVVPDEVLAALPSPTRVSGPNRYATTAAIAKWAGSNGVPTSSVLVASGRTEALADTLSGGQLGRPILYVTKSSVPSTVRTWLEGVSDLSVATVLGGTAAVSMTTGGAVQTAVLR